MGHKAAETTWNINKLVAPGTPKEHRVQWWFKKFFKGEESLDDEEHSGRLLEVDNDPLRASSKHILLKLHVKLSMNPKWTTLWSFGIWSKLEKWESSISGCLMSPPKKKKKKKPSFWSVVFSYYMQQQTIFQLDCGM